ncbi:MAG: ribonuclease P protein component [bacterium]
MSYFSLSKQLIIKKLDVFNELFKKGASLNSNHIMLLFLESDKSRFGFAVSKKIKGAIKRNRAKRRLREVLRLNQSHLPNNIYLVLVAKPGIERVKFELLNKEFLNLIKKLNYKVIQ